MWTPGHNTHTYQERPETFQERSKIGNWTELQEEKS